MPSQYFSNFGWVSQIHYQKPIQISIDGRRAGLSRSEGEISKGASLGADTLNLSLLQVYWTKADQSRQQCRLSILVILVGFHKYTIKSKSKYQLMVVEQACLDQREKSARAFAAAPRPGTVSPISGHAPSFPRGPPAFPAIFLQYFCNIFRVFLG